MSPYIRLLNGMLTSILGPPFDGSYQVFECEVDLGRGGGGIR